MLRVVDDFDFVFLWLLCDELLWVSCDGDVVIVDVFVVEG